jgi:protein sidekick
MLDQLEPSSTYEFRVFARNRLGVGYPSLTSAPFTTPETLAVPFYYDWRFLLALVLFALLFFFIVVAVLCWTGRHNRHKCEFYGNHGFC